MHQSQVQMAKVVSLALALGLFSTVTGQGNVVCLYVCGGEARKCSTSQGNTLTLACVSKLRAHTFSHGKAHFILCLLMCLRKIYLLCCGAIYI